jgi:AcrR family transcriptional regulator
MKDADTKTRILDAAERLFASGGFSATSLRMIIREAEVNTAAVHYHFGSREGLIDAVLQRRAARINEERLRILSELEAHHGPDNIPPREVVEAFLGPAVRTHFDPTSRDFLSPRLMSRAITEANVEIHEIFKKFFGEVFMRYSAALERAIPHVTAVDIRWRMHFMIGALAFAIAIPGFGSGAGGEGRHPGSREKLGPTDDAELVLRRLVDYVTAGMCAPSGEAGTSPPARGAARSGAARQGHGDRAAAGRAPRKGAAHSTDSGPHEEKT